MSVLKLVEAVKAGDVENVAALLDSGEAIGQQDGYGWTALNWAAGKGNPDTIRLLLAAGADITHAGRDKRTAYQIALAAAQTENAAVLYRAEQEAGIRLDPGIQDYCKAYVAADLKQFPGWPSQLPGLADEDLVFLHADLSVTRSMLAGKEVLFAGTSVAWEIFCKQQLAFKVPGDLEWAAAFSAKKPVTAAQPEL